MRKLSLLGLLIPGLLALLPHTALPARSATAATAAPAAPGTHVVIVGIPGLRWSDVSPSGTPALESLAAAGSAGSLVDFAAAQRTCPADAWLTLGGGARAQEPRPQGQVGAAAPCPALPDVVPDGTAARIPAMAGIVGYNAKFDTDPDWGLLGSAARCSTAVGPGAALALASRSGWVPGYLPSAARVTAAVLARCPLTVIELGQNQNYPERTRLAQAAGALSWIVADLPAGATLLVAGLGATAGPPHLQVIVVSGPGYRAGLLDAASTRQPGIVTLTDLAPTVAGWLGRPVPARLPGARITRGDRAGAGQPGGEQRSLAAAVRVLDGRDTAEQVWRATHAWFFAVYAVVDALAFGLPWLLFRENRRPLRPRDATKRTARYERWLRAAQRASTGADLGRGPQGGLGGRAVPPGGGPPGGRPPGANRARWWRAAGAFAAAVPAGTFLANLVPWWLHAHPAAWLYGMAAAWTLVLGAAALAGPWRRDPLGPPGVICLGTLALLGADVMTGSRLQLQAPFGLSLLEAGRFYGIGNEVLGVYCVSALFGATWLASLALRLAPHQPFTGGIATGGLNVRFSRFMIPGERPAGWRGADFAHSATKKIRHFRQKMVTRRAKSTAVVNVTGWTATGAGTPARAAAASQHAAAPAEASEQGTPAGPSTGPFRITPETAGGEGKRRAEPGRRTAVAVVAGVGAFAVVACGWPGFGAKAGGTIVLVPCFILLGLAVAGTRVRRRHWPLIAASGVALLALFAMASYFVPAVRSDIGAFAGDLVRGHGGGLLHRKISSDIGTLTVSPASPLVPVAMVAAGLALWRPGWLRLTALPRLLSARPPLRAVAWLTWLVLTGGWAVDDSGVVVVAAALPFALPLLAGALAAVSCEPGETGYVMRAFAGSGV